jgi:hypothetical protein
MHDEHSQTSVNTRIRTGSDRAPLNSRSTRHRSNAAARTQVCRSVAAALPHRSVAAVTPALNVTAHIDLLQLRCRYDDALAAAMAPSSATRNG